LAVRHRNVAPRNWPVCLKIDDGISLGDAEPRTMGYDGVPFFPGGNAMAEGRDITAEVKRIIKEQLDVDEKDIKPEATFIDDLGADSLGLVELVLAFEEAFEIDIPDEDTEKIRSVQDAITYIEAHTKK
jgi:acyl carrier protein